MASKSTGKRARVVHRRTFQNSNQVVELTVRTIPKSTGQTLRPAAALPFTRDCALKRELENVMKEKNNNTPHSAKTRNAGKSPPGNAKGRPASGGHVSVEVLRKKADGEPPVSRKKANTKEPHRLLGRDQTWGEFLNSCSSVGSLSGSISSIHSEDQQQHSPRHPGEPAIQTLYAVQKDRYTPRAEIGTVMPSQMRLETGRSRTSSRQMPLLSSSPDEPCAHSSPSQPEERGRIEHFQGTEDRRRSYQPGADEVARDRPAHKSREEVPHQDFGSQSEQTKVPGSNRLLSDDVNASPFGESALQLLRQLKERLQTIGDNEGSDLVGVIEAFIGGQGSLGGIGSDNAPPAPSPASASPQYPPVFVTPAHDNNAFYYPTPHHHHLNHYHRRNLSDGQPLEHLGHSPQQNLENQSSKKFTTPELPVQVTGRSNSLQIPQDEQQGSRGRQQRSHSLAAGLPELPSMQVGLQQSESGRVSPVSTTPSHLHRQDQHGDDCHNECKRTIDKQKQVITEQELTISQLHQLGSLLVAQQDKINSRNLLDVQKPVKEGDSGVAVEDGDKSPQSTAGNNATPPHRGEEEEEAQSDGESEPTKQTEVQDLNQSEQEHRMMLLQLQMENKTLRQHLRKYCEVNANLEIQLRKAYELLESERRSNSSLSRSRSKLSGSVPNLDLSVRPPADSKSSRTGPLSLNSADSEVDSAYEDKSSSRFTSKQSSPHLELQQQQGGREFDLGTTSGVLSRLPQATRPERSPTVAPGEGGLPSVAPLQDICTQRKGTAPSEDINSATVPSQQFSTRMQPSSAHESSTIAHRSSEGGERFKEPDATISSPSNCQGNSGQDVARAHKVHHNPLQTINTSMPDLKVMGEDKSWVPLEDLEEVTLSCISNTSNRQDSSVTHEASFLHGIKAPRHTKVLHSQENKLKRVEEASCSSTILNQPLESTRVQESSPTERTDRETGSSLFAPIAVECSSGDLTFDSVELLA